MMKEMNKLGLGAKMGSKAKQQALRGMSATGELAPGAKGGGGFGLGSLFGRGKGDPAAAEGGPGPGGLGDLGGLGGGDLSGMLSGPRPMGASATRKSAAKRKEKERKKRKKGKRR
jgi:hypothetical protein